MEILSTDLLLAHALTLTGRVRKANEDSMGNATVPLGELFVVCDGMGGHVGGAVASSIAVKTIIDSMKENTGDIPTALDTALRWANRAIIEETGRQPSLTGMGTTACIVLVSGQEAWIAHVGDSRIYLFDGGTRVLHRITKDHSLVQSLVDCGEIDDREAEHHPQKNVILRALGLSDELRTDIEKSPVKLASGDMLLICSDGLSGMIDDGFIEAGLRKVNNSGSVPKVLQELVDEANSPDKGRDNITAQLIYVRRGSAPGRTYPDFNPAWRKQTLSAAVPDSPKGGKNPIIPILAVCLAIILGVSAFAVWKIYDNSRELKKQLAEKTAALESQSKQLYEMRVQLMQYQQKEIERQQEEMQRLLQSGYLFPGEGQTDSTQVRVDADDLDEDLLTQVDDAGGDGATGSQL